jgi:hypothetical protein
MGQTITRRQSIKDDVSLISKAKFRTHWKGKTDE